MAGVALCRGIGIDMASAFMQMARYLGLQLPVAPGKVRVFTGPGNGCSVEPSLLARSCWALALLSEVYRGGLAVMVGSPLGQFRGRMVSADDLLALCPPAGLDQLTQFRQVFEARLIPQLERRPGLWALGPTFSGSGLINADADLIAGGLLLDLKTSAKLTLAVTDLFQIIGYALLDFEDAYRITELGIFAARYGYLAAWDVSELLDELAGKKLGLDAVRSEFRALLEAGTDRRLT